MERGCKSKQEFVRFDPFYLIWFQYTYSPIRDTSITDPWARMISYHFLNGTTRQNFFTNDSAHGAGQLWSQIPDIPSFQSYHTPFPLIVADSRPAGDNSTGGLPPEPVVYEVCYCARDEMKTKPWL